MRHKGQRLSDFIEDLARKDKRQGQHIPVGQFVDDLHKKGHMVVCLIFAAPFLLPIPIPGMSTIFGAVIILAAIQMMLNRDPWLPHSWRDRQLPVSMIEKTFSHLANLLRRVEFIFKPRWSIFAIAKYSAQINGFVLLVLAGLLALPMPPGFNAPPAVAIILLSIGVLEEDGLAVLMAWILSLMNIALFTAFFKFGYEGIKALMNL